MHLDAALLGPDQRGLEPLADLVALPDVGLEQDLLLRAVDRREHVVIEIHAEGVRGERALTDLDGARRRDREGAWASSRGGDRSP